MTGFIWHYGINFFAVPDISGATGSEGVKHRNELH